MEVFMYKKIAVFLLLGLNFFVINSYADDNYKDRYLSLLRNEQYAELKLLLEQWEIAEPQNSEMYIGFFNYYVHTGAVQGSGIMQDGDGRLVLGPTVSYKSENVYKGIEYLDKGLAFAPNRLDMYWGKIELLMEIGDYAKAGEILYNLIGLSPGYNNNWRLGDNRPVQDGENYFLGYIMRYFAKCIEIKTSESLEIAKKCSEKIMETYPQSTYGYNILGNYYTAIDNFEEALKIFLLAEGIDNTDCIVLINIGIMYIEKNSSEKARDYFNRVLRLGNENEKRQAQYYLDRL
jgi:tetratricopeptide (TPR) repeat protein